MRTIDGFVRSEIETKGARIVVTQGGSGPPPSGQYLMEEAPREMEAELLAFFDSGR